MTGVLDESVQVLESPVCFSHLSSISAAVVGALASETPLSPSTPKNWGQPSSADGSAARAGRLPEAQRQSASNTAAARFFTEMFPIFSLPLDGRGGWAAGEDDKKRPSSDGLSCKKGRELCIRDRKGRAV